MYIYLNDKLLEDGKVQIAYDSPGLLYGYGVFETIKIYNGKSIFLYEHLERMRCAATFLKLNFTESMESAALKINNLLTVNNISNGSVRITLFKGAGEDIIMLHVKAVVYDESSYKEGFKLIISDSRRNDKSPLCSIKSVNYMDNILARNEALEKGFNEALLLNTEGVIAEGTISNVFWVKDSIAYTPELSCGILPGIVREKVIKLFNSHGIKLIEGRFTPANIFEADEVFITNSLMGVMPVSMVNDVGYRIKEYKIASCIGTEYERIVLDNLF